MGIETAIAVGLAGAALGGGVLKAKGSLDQAEAAAQAAEFNRAKALQDASAEEARIRREARKELGRRALGAAKAGVLLEGTPLDLLAQTAAEFELEAVNARVAGANTANLERRRAKNLRKQGRSAAISELIGGTTSAVSSLFGNLGGGGGTGTSPALEG